MTKSGVELKLHEWDSAIRSSELVAECKADFPGRVNLENFIHCGCRKALHLKYIGINKNAAA